MSDETTGRPTEAPLCYEMLRPGVRGVGEAIALIRAGEWGGAVGPGNAIATVWLGGPAGTSAAPEDVEATAASLARASNAFEPMRRALDMLSEQIKVRIDPGLLEELGRASVGDITIRADVLLACLRALRAADALRSAGVEPTP